MDCNRDEATRAKLIAEAMFEQNDFEGAMKFALKAQALYPGLHGISHMLATLDIFVSSAKKINGEIDWYGVLSVEPIADDETIRKRYKRLALLLHPDKNHSPGADGAFKLVSEAKDLLLDKEKRSAYNQITGHEAPQPKVPPQASNQPETQPAGASTHASDQWVRNNADQSAYTAPPAHAGGPSGHTSPFPQWAHTTGSSAPSKERVAPHKRAAKSKKKSPKKSMPFYRAPASLRSDMFWTLCQRCQLHFEYLLLFKNNIVICPSCYMPFLALGMPRPQSKSRSHKPKPWPPQNYQPRYNLCTPTANGQGPGGPGPYPYTVYCQGPFFGTSGGGDQAAAYYAEPHGSVGIDEIFKKQKMDHYHYDYGYGGIYDNVPPGHPNVGNANVAAARAYGFMG